MVEYKGYLVSKDGRVFSVKWGRLKEIGWTDSSGYRKVRLYNRDGSYSVYKIHRLVANTYIPKVDGKTHVNHKNGVKCDNRVENLEWCTSLENDRHARANGLKGGPYKYTQTVVKEIERLMLYGMSSREIARNLLLSKSQVARIMKELRAHEENRPREDS